MAKGRIKKYSRRTSMSSHRRKVSPVVISVISFILLSLVISVAVGIILGERAERPDSGKYFDFERVEYDSHGKKVASVEAYRLPKGHNAADYVDQGINELSVKLRDSEGSLEYYFEVGEKLSLDSMDADSSFSALAESAHSRGGYVCAYVYITSFACEDEMLREVYKAYEISLISEAAERGADDILLLGLNVTDENIAELEEFTARAANAAGEAVLGVGVSKQTLMLAEKEVYYAGRLRAACDYIALDLTYLSDNDTAEHTSDDGERTSLLKNTLDECEYYIKAYSMRTLFSEESREVYREASDMGLVNFQVIGK